MPDHELTKMLEGFHRHIDASFEALTKEIDAVGQAVAGMREDLARTDEKIERTAAETQALLKFSCTELNQTDLERLDDSAH